MQRIVLLAAAAALAWLGGCGDIQVQNTLPDAGGDTGGGPSCTGDADCTGKVTLSGDCQVASCQQGSCVAANAADGTGCNDGDACTQTDTCQGGTCQGANPVQCTAADACHEVGTCDPATGQCDDPVKAGSCQIGDACVADGSANPENSCQYCDSVFSQENWRNQPDGTACDDGDPVTGGDVCSGGVCAGMACDCSTLNECCDGCFAVTDGTPCSDDAIACTDDVCGAGACTHAPQNGWCRIDGICLPDGSLNPDNACQYCDSVFDPSAWRNKVDGSGCDDGDGCTQTDTCSAGTCTGADPVTCTALDQCHGVGACQPETGQCNNPALDDGTGCDDGNPATGGDTCQNGFCVGAGCDCAGTTTCCDGCLAINEGGGCGDDNLACTDDQCQGGYCAHPLQAGHCLIDGACWPQGANNPENECLFCNPAASVDQWRQKDPGTLCDDGNACSEISACYDGDCIGDGWVDCVVSSQCHDLGVCVPETGECTSPMKPDGTPCEDGSPCTIEDRCMDGACAAGEELPCPDPAQCQWLFGCSEDTGECIYEPEEDGLGCDDGDPDTGPDTCVNGQCIGEGCSCSGDTGCCDGCQPINEGEECADDNLECTADLCLGGFCKHPLLDDWCLISGKCRQADEPNPGNPCEYCNPDEPGIWTVQPGAPCDDGNMCTDGDKCSDTGACMSGDEVQCQAMDQCHKVGSCIPDSGECTNPTQPNGLPCDDGDTKTLVDECVYGECTCKPAYKFKDCPTSPGGSGALCAVDTDGCMGPSFECPEGCDLFFACNLTIEEYGQGIVGVGRCGQPF